MKTWTLKFASYKQPDDILNAIESGLKVIETRPYTPNDSKDYSKIERGDKLIFVSLDTGKKIQKTALGTKVYKTVAEMLQQEDYENIFPGIGSKESLLSVYEEVKEKWGPEYKYNLEHYGIVAIYIL